MADLASSAFDFSLLYKANSRSGLIFSVVCLLASGILYGFSKEYSNDERHNFKCGGSSLEIECRAAYNDGPNQLQANAAIFACHFFIPLAIYFICSVLILTSRKHIYDNGAGRVHVYMIHFVRLILLFIFYFIMAMVFLIFYQKIALNVKYSCYQGKQTISCADGKAKSKTILNISCLTFDIVAFLCCIFELLYFMFKWKKRPTVGERPKGCKDCIYFIEKYIKPTQGIGEEMKHLVPVRPEETGPAHTPTKTVSSNKLKRRYLERCHKMKVLEVSEDRLPRIKELDMDNWCLSFRFVQETDADDAFSKISGEREHYMRNMLKFSKGRSTNSDDLVQNQFSFLRGIAGIGKTTITRFLAWRWANEEIFQEFTHLILIDAKELSTDVDEFLNSELKDLNGTVDPNASVLIILDGLDEIKNLNVQITDTQSSLFKLLNMRTTVIDSFKLIVTGRPHIQSILTSHCKREIKIFELCPLEDKDIEKYIQNFEKEDDKKAMNETLKSSHCVDNVKRIPQYLNTLCCVAVFTGGLSVKSVTELYVWMFKIFYMAHVTRRTDLKTDQIFGDKDFKAFVKDIGKISYELIQENKLIFEERDFKAIVQRMQKSDRKDFFNAFFSKTDSAHTTEFKFVHFSLQEFFASLHVFRGNVKFSAFLERREYNMMKYVCGLYGSLRSESKNLTKDFTTICLEGKDKPFDIKSILNALRHSNIFEDERLSVALELVIEFASWNESSITDLLETFISVADDKTLPCGTWQSQYNLEKMLKSLENQNSLSPLKEVFLNLPAVEHVDIVKWCKCFNSVFLDLGGVSYENQHEVLKLLNGKDGDIKLGVQNTPFMDIELVKKIKENGINLCCFTSLHYAAFEGDLEYLKEYFKKSSSSDFLDWMDQNGEPPLNFAAAGGHLYVTRLLLDEGANINLTNQDGQTPLHYAARGGHVDVARLFLDEGANINLTDQDGQTPLHFAAGEGHSDVTRLLLDEGANVNLTNQYGQTLLHCAAAGGHVDTARLLLGKGADVGLTNIDWHTPLHYAAREGHVDVARLLLDEGANINLTNRDGQTPLHYAAFEGQMDVARLLLDEGANINLTNQYGETPLDVAKRGLKICLESSKPYWQDKIPCQKEIVKLLEDKMRELEASV